MERGRENPFRHHVPERLIGVAGYQSLTETGHALAERRMLVRPLAKASQGAAKKDQGIVEGILARNHKLLMSGKRAGHVRCIHCSIVREDAENMRTPRRRRRFLV